MADPVLSTLASGTSTTATTSPTFTTPAPGTLLLLSVSSDDYRTTTGTGRPESSGWALVNSGQDFLGHYLWYKFAAGSETGVSYTIGSAARSVYAIVAATNVDNGTAPTSTSSLHTHGGASVPTTAITPTAGSRWLVVASLGAMSSSATSMTGIGALTNTYTTQVTSLFGGTSGANPSELATIGYLTLDGGTSTSTSGNPTGTSGVCNVGLLGAFKVSTGAATVDSPAMPRPFPPFAAPFIFPRAVPFQMLGDRTTPTVATAVSLDDTAAASDGLAVTATAALADTATGTDTVGVAVALSLADTATGTDTLSATAAVAISDAAAGTDTVAVTAATPLGDTATGTDSLSVTVTVPLGDTATATDAFTVATGTDPNQAWPAVAWMFLAPNDAAFQLAGDTTLNTNAVTLTDTATGVDALTVSATVGLAETATATDALTVTVTVALADTSTGADAVTAAAAVPLGDTATAADTIGANATVALAETATGTDALSVAGSSNPQLPDTATGSDALAVAAGLALADTVAAADGITVAPAVTLADTITAVDGLTVTVTVTIADVAHGTDNMTSSGAVTPKIVNARLTVVPNRSDLTVAPNLSALSVRRNAARLEVQ